MDTYLQNVDSHLKLCRLLLIDRIKKLEASKKRESRHYSRLAHSRALLSLIEEVAGLVLQDPDVWDEEPDLVPF